MIKVYKTLQEYIANKHKFFTIPGSVKLRYKKHALQLWEANVTVFSDNIVCQFIDEWCWMDISDDDGEYIGMFKVTKIKEEYQGGVSKTNYQLVHAFSTLMDDPFLMNDVRSEYTFDTLNSHALINFMISQQQTPHWQFVPIAYSGDTTDVHLKRQNGLLSYIYQALAEMGPKYTMLFDTTSYPWKCKVKEAKATIECRVREEYNLLQYSMDKDYAPYYNRLYIYGEEDILGAPIPDHREPIKKPKITSDMSKKQVDAAWKRYDEAVKKRQEEDAKRKADDEKAWKEYNKKYKEWAANQTKMTEKRDKALKERQAAIARGERPEGGYFKNLPPRASTVPPPEKPSLQTRETKSKPLSISTLNDGKPYIEDPEEIAKRGIISRVVEFKDVKNQQLLMDMATRMFESRQARTLDLSISAVELNKMLETDIPIDDFHLGQHLLMQTKDNGDFDLVIVGEGKEDVYGAPYDIQLDISEVKNANGSPKSSPVVMSPYDKVLQQLDTLQRDVMAARHSADGKNTIYTGPLEPQDPEINDVWYKTITDPVTFKTETEMYIYNGAIWVNPFDSLKQAMQDILNNEKELDFLREEAEKSAKELEKAIEDAKVSLIGDIKENQETIRKLNEDLEVKLGDLQTAIDKANNSAANAAEEAKKLLAGDIEALKTELNQKVADDVAALESTITLATDNKIASAKEDLLAQAQAIGDGVKTEINGQLGELSATVAETKHQADALTTKVSEVKQTVDGFSARILASEETSEANKTKIAQIQNSVDSLSSTISDITTSTDGMEKRLSTVEQTSTELKTLIETTQENLGGKISSLNSRVETAEGSLAAISKTNEENSTAITSMNKRLSTAEGNISSISTNVDGLTTKTNTIQSTVDTNKATIASQKEEIDKAGKKITTLSSSLTQTQDQVSGIITNYAKKTDLKGLATEEYTQTQIDAKAGELSQTISSQKKSIDANTNSISSLKQTDTSIKADIEQLKKDQTGTTTKISSFEQTLDGMSTTVSTVSTDLDKAKEDISSNTSKINQTDSKIQTIVTDYAKKTDLKGYVNESTVSTIVTQKVGELTTSLQEDVKKTKGDVSTLTTKVNTTKQTVDGMESKIATYENYGDGTGVINTLNLLKRDISSLTSEIQNKNYMSIINQQAGKILFRVSKNGDGKKQGYLAITEEGAIMDAAFIKTAHISDMSVTNAKIASLSADKLTAGTIDAKLIRVINIDASNITAGTISGHHSEWNLDTGHFRNGKTREQYIPGVVEYDPRPIDQLTRGPMFSSIEMDYGMMVFRKQGRKLVTMDYYGIGFWGTKNYSTAKEIPESTLYADIEAEMFGSLSPGWWGSDNIKDANDANVGLKNLALRHNGQSTLTISYQSEEAETTYYPYVAFDNRKILNGSMGGMTCYQPADFRDAIVSRKMMIIAGSLTQFRAVKSNLYDNSGDDKGLFLGKWNSWGLLINERGIFWISGAAAWGGKGVARADRKNAALRISNAGDRDYQGGLWYIQSID